MSIGRRGWLVAVAIGVGAVLGARMVVAQPAGELSAARVAEILAAADRTAADRTNDLRRKPEQLLPFIGPRVGMTALDISSGGGYTVELLARAIGPTGKVYGQGRPPRDPAAPPRPAVAPEGNSHPGLPAAPAAAPAPTGPRPLAVVLGDRAARMQAAGVAAAPIMPVVQSFEAPVPADVAAGSVDLVTLIFNYHDLGHLGVDRDAMNRAVFQALKSGGHYVIADHAGRAGTGISEAGTLHRIEEAFLKREVEAAGFRVVAEGQFLRNPNDPRDKNTPDPPQPKDEFVLKFVKP